MLIITIDGVSHIVTKYDTDLVDETGKTHCGLEFSLWESVHGMSLAPMPTFEWRDGPGSPEGSRWCEGCLPCGCQKCQRPGS